ncbi:hypothetical protein BKA67DRAFT_550246 [Truncatella angustata]|uniref:Protein FAF1 n=1 Tax=Truncatella angustata TaxID=152316 RepID=A0A9P8UZT4_9PEZI|nr:uncharacterized protein BKA67DRAFT_550246 [Truncatella angustata]KAH6661125.1 hypothetical protein BKA67DRAFT_550246 [Truncatella angustata]KAH8202460.1 hypothetical protein TruAng_003360 [Truncatella angustata]
MTVLGKRKSRSAAPEKPAISEEEAQAIFRRHFEAQFMPLEESNPHGEASTSADTENDGDGLEDLRSSDEEDDWDGLSGSDGDDDDEAPEPITVEVVDYSKSSGPINPLAAALAKRESKRLLSSKVPLSDAAAAVATKSKTKTPTDEDTTDLLKNDLALQRLLSESHLFNPSGHSSSMIGSSAAAVDTEHSGRNRHVATDMRLSALGSKASVFRQEKMPMSHRKGIEGAKVARESKRRREAKDNGIILEREVKKTTKRGGSGGSGRRERAVDAPAVGKLMNGMLRLSKKDVAEINGPVRSSGKMKKRRR